MNTARKNRPIPGMFDAEALQERIAAIDHPLLRINAMVAWEKFRPVLEEVFTKEKKGPGGRPPYDRVVMFKVLVLKHLYNIPDQQMEQRLLGDLFFRNFLGLTFSDPTPDEKTIWLFQNTLSDAGIILDLFDAFDAQLAAHNLTAKSGVIVDATIVPVPVQHISKKDRDTLDRGETPAEWIAKPAIARQRDTEAAWTKKHKRSYFGYKDHIKIDRETKLISSFEVTPANDHDSQPLPVLLDEEEDHGQELYADAAYVGEPIAKTLRDCGMKDRRHRKAFKNAPLNRYQKRKNKEKSKIRARVEHIFGAMRMSMADIRIRTIGLVRATFVIGMRNMIYNMRRGAHLLSLKPAAP
jgi:IS5 family transposase